MKTLLVTDKASLRTVSLNRSDVHNAFNAEMIQELTQVFKETQGIRAVVLKGEGKSFCAGADLGWMKSMAGFSFAENVKDSEKLYEMFEAIYDCDVPVVARVHGNVFGGGVGLVAACDIVGVLPETKFCFSEAKLGLVPAVISNFVARKMRPGFVRQMMLTAQTFDGEEALDAGLVHFCGSSEEVDDFVQSQVDFILGNGPESIKATKSLLDYITSHSQRENRDESVRVISERRVSAEGQEGMKAFFEKRKPNWKS